MSLSIYLFLVYICFMVSFEVRRDGNKAVNIYIIIGIIIILSSFSVLLIYGNYPSYDRGNYAEQYNLVYPLFIQQPYNILKQPNEIAFISFSVLLKYIFGDTNTMFYVYAILPIMGALVFLYKEKNYSFTRLFILFILSLYPLYTTYLCSQMCASAFFILALFCYFRENKILYVIFILIASLFHATALIGFPLLFVLIYVHNKNRLYQFLIGLSSFFFIVMPIISYLLRHISYLSSKFDISILNTNTYTVALKGLAFLVIGLVGLKYRDQLMFHDCRIDSLIVLSLFTGFCWIFAIKGYWLYRISIYTMIPSFSLVECIRVNLKNRKVAFMSYTFFVTFSALVTFREILLLY